MKRRSKICLIGAIIGLEIMISSMAILIYDEGISWQHVFRNYIADARKSGDIFEVRHKLEAAREIWTSNCDENVPIQLNYLIEEIVRIGIVDNYQSWQEFTSLKDVLSTADLNAPGHPITLRFIIEFLGMFGGVALSAISVKLSETKGKQ